MIYDAKAKAALLQTALANLDVLIPLPDIKLLERSLAEALTAGQDSRSWELTDYAKSMVLANKRITALKAVLRMSAEELADKLGYSTADVRDPAMQTDRRIAVLYLKTVLIKLQECAGLT